MLTSALASAYLLSRGVVVSPGTLKRQASKGRIEAVKISNRWFFEESELNRYAVEQAGKVGNPNFTRR